MKILLNYFIFCCFAFNFQQKIIKISVLLFNLKKSRFSSSYKIFLPYFLYRTVIHLQVSENTRLRVDVDNGWGSLNLQPSLCNKHISIRWNLFYLYLYIRLILYTLPFPTTGRVRLLKNVDFFKILVSMKYEALVIRLGLISLHN